MKRAKTILKEKVNGILRDSLSTGRVNKAIDRLISTGAISDEDLSDEGYVLAKAITSCICSEVVNTASANGTSFEKKFKSLVKNISCFLSL